MFISTQQEEPKSVFDLEQRLDAKLAKFQTENQRQHQDLQRKIQLV